MNDLVPNCGHKLHDCLLSDTYFMACRRLLVCKVFMIYIDIFIERGGGRERELGGGWKINKTYRRR